MAAKRKPQAVREMSERKVAKTFRLAPGRIESARRILGVPTATAAIETALDMVVFRRELMDGSRSMRGVVIQTFEHPDG